MHKRLLTESNTILWFKKKAWKKPKIERTYLNLAKGIFSVLITKIILFFKYFTFIYVTVCLREYVLGHSDAFTGQQRILANNYFKVFNILSFQQNVNYDRMVIIKKTSTIYAGEDVEKEPLFTIGIINEHIYY